TVMWPAEQRQIGERRRAAAGPPDQVMPVAPTEWPGAARKDTVSVPRLERAPGRRRKGPAGVIELMLQLALAGDPANSAIAGIALHGLRGHRTAALELARRRALDPSQGVEARADDQLWPRPGTVAPAV